MHAKGKRVPSLSQTSKESKVERWILWRAIGIVVDTASIIDDMATSTTLKNITVSANTSITLQRIATFCKRRKFTRVLFLPISSHWTVSNFSNFKYGECYRDKTVSTQVDLLGAQEIDPDTLPYEGKMMYYLKEFCYTTSAHGIPMIAANEHFFSRGFWSLLYVVLLKLLFIIVFSNI